MVDQDPAMQPRIIEQHSPLTAQLIDFGGVESRLLLPVATESRSRTEVNLDNEPSMSSVSDEAQHVDQNLLGIVRAGSEHFGIVRATLTDTGQTGLILTRFATEAKPAAVVMLVAPEEPITIGREEQKSLGFAADVSKRHFDMVLRGSRNQLVIRDVGSSNATEVVVPRDSLPATREASQVALKGLKRLKKQSDPLPAIENPLNDTNIWAPKPEDVRGDVKSLQPNSLFRAMIDNERRERLY